MISSLTILFLLLLSFLLLTTKLIYSSKDDVIICPSHTILEKKFYEINVALQSENTICHEMATSKRILAILLDEAFFTENNLIFSHTNVCSTTKSLGTTIDNNTSDELFNESSSSSSSLLEEEAHAATDDQQHRNLLWGQYIYRGGSRCLFCNPDIWDFRHRRRRISQTTSSSRLLQQQQRQQCNHTDVHLSTDDFLPFNWDGTLITKVYEIPPLSSKIVIAFRILFRDDAHVDWLQLSTPKGFSLRLNQQTIFHKQRHQKSSSSSKRFWSKQNQVSWVYKTFASGNNNNGRGIEFAIHFHQSFFETYGKRDQLVFYLKAQRSNPNIGFIESHDEIVMARQFCDTNTTTTTTTVTDNDNDRPKHDGRSIQKLQRRITYKLRRSLRKWYRLNGHRLCAKNKKFSVTVHLTESTRKGEGRCANTPSK